MWITNAYQADWVCLLVNTEQDKPIHLNKSLVCVPMDSKGITLAKRIDKMGMRASDTGIIYFEDVRVPIANIIGQEGYGFTYQMMQVNKSNFFSPYLLLKIEAKLIFQFQEERLAAVALSLTPLEKCITDTIESTRTRTAFGRPLLDNQV